MSKSGKQDADLARRPGAQLSTLASEIRDEVEQAEQHWHSAVTHAIRAGELLIEAKAQVGHGGWQQWLEENFPKSPRSAQGYMKLARNAEKAQELAHLGIEGTLKQLAAPKPTRPEDQDLAWKAATTEKLIHCQHVTEEQWDEYMSKCGEMYVIELLVVHGYGCVRETHPNDDVLAPARDAVVHIALSDHDGIPKWARDVLKGERPPENFWKTQRAPVDPTHLRKLLADYNKALWAMGDWANELGDGALTELIDVIKAGQEGASA